MHLFVDSQELNLGILSVIKALPVRSAMPILDGIYFEADSSGLHLKCSDLMLQKECSIPATIEEEGVAIIPGKLFSEIVRKMPEGSIEFVLNGKTLNLSCGRAKSSIQCIEYEAFPEMRFSGETFKLTMDAKELHSMIMETVFATSLDESKPILTGALVEISDMLRIVATDSYQFALRQTVLNNGPQSRDVIIPGKSLLEVARMMEEEADEDAELIFTSTHVKVMRRNSVMVARLLDGDYIKYRQIIPSSYKTRVLVNRLELMESIDRAQLMAREGNNNIVMSFKNGQLHISAMSNSGNMDESVDCTIMGEDIDIAFNPKYCMNILKCIEDETIYMDFLTNISPAVIRPVSGENYYYLIVPVRIYSQY